MRNWSELAKARFVRSRSVRKQIFNGSIIRRTPPFMQAYYCYLSHGKSITDPAGEVSHHIPLFSLPSESDITRLTLRLLK